jgi:hypothetical protein
MKKTNKCYCQCNTHSTEAFKTLTITWQRLIAGGETCPRCGSTENELDNAVLQLKDVLGPKGVKVIVKKTKLTLKEFKKNPIRSNRILFNGKTLEELIRAKTGQSQCCDACGDEECRTLEIGGESHEVIPADLIVKAGLIAASKCLI